MNKSHNRKYSIASFNEYPACTEMITLNKASKSVSADAVKAVIRSMKVNLALQQNKFHHYDLNLNPTSKDLLICIHKERQYLRRMYDILYQLDKSLFISQDVLYKKELFIDWEYIKECLETINNKAVIRPLTKIELNDIYSEIRDECSLFTI